MSKFFIADPIHINRKNFGSLYEYFEESKAHTIFNEERQNWISLFGDYSAHQEQLNEELLHLQSLSQDELFNLTVLEINIFKVARAEMLSLLITRSTIINTPLPATRREIFNYIYDTEQETLLFNMAAAIQWINHWAATIKKYNPKFVLVFSGSLIYARTLLELLKNSAPRAFVLESFFTGSDNYIEEKYEPIANNSNLKFKAYYRSLGSNDSPAERDRNRNKAVNKILSGVNKNVVQPLESKEKLFKNNQKTVLITGQVLNDFSLLEHKDLGLNSLCFYKEIISKVLSETDLNVIFKAHPWERKKRNITTPLTFNELSLYFETNEKGYNSSERLLILEDYNIKSIFRQTEYVLGLNSQALLEAAFEGFQPVQFANAFYGNLGFTSDYPLERVDDFIDDLKAGKVPSRLGLAQYRSYEEFITKALQFSLVSAFPSGKIMLKTIFNITPHITLISKQAQNAKPQETKAAAPKQTVQPEKTSQSAQPAKPTKPVQPAKPNKPAQPVIAAAQTPASSEKSPDSKSKKKWGKFFKSPKKFFLDSKNKKIRWLHHFFWSLS
jgi:hypothetical protein